MIVEDLERARPGDIIHPSVYIRDYADGTVPLYRVVEVEVRGPVRLIVVEDVDQPEVRWRLIVGGRWFARLTKPGCACDVRQQQRRWKSQRRPGAEQAVLERAKGLAEPEQLLLLA